MSSRSSPTTFEADHDGVEVEFSFGSSTDLAEQVADGAPGDVLATADETSMHGRRGRRRHRRRSETFATNVLVIVTPPDNPAGIAVARRPRRRHLGALRRRGAVRPGRARPCSRTTGSPPSRSASRRTSKPTLDKVISGEADAGLVYATDAVAAGDAVNAIEIPGAEDQLTSYFIATLEQSEDSDLAQEWVDLVLSDEGQAGARGSRLRQRREP